MTSSSNRSFEPGSHRSSKLSSGTRRRRRGAFLRSLEVLEDRRVLSVYYLQGVNPAPVPVEGVAMSSTTPLATFATDSDPSGLSALVAWGDASASAGTIANVGVVNIPGVGTVPEYVVYGSHTYSAGTAGQSFSLQILVNDASDLSTGSLFTTTTVAPAQSPSQLSATPVVVTEGATIPAGTVVGTISYTQGQSPDPIYAGTATFPGATGATALTFVADGPSSFLITTSTATSFTSGSITPGSYNFSLAVTDNATPVASAVGNLYVNDASLTADATQPTVTASQGVPFSNQPVANFTDANTTATAADFLAIIDWGDGSPESVGTVTGAAGAFTVSGNHTYLSSLGSPYTVTVTFRDLLGGTIAVATTTAEITPATLSILPVSQADTLIEGPTYTEPVAAFTTNDPSAGVHDFAASIDWGDGSNPTVGVISQLPDGSFVVSGSHAYKQANAYPVSVLIQDLRSGLSFDNQITPATLLVNDAPLTSAGAPINGTEGVALPATTVVATFTDSNPNSLIGDFTAVINWGDGTAPVAGTIVKIGTSPNGTIYAVQGTHTYTNKGNYTVVTSISSVNGSESEAVSNALMADAPPVVTPINFVTDVDKQFYQPVAFFFENYGPPTGLQPGVNYTATIDWGDGSPSSLGIIVAAPGGYQVYGTHTYHQSRTVLGSNQFPVTVTIHDNVSAIASVTSFATVNTVQLVGWLDPASDSGFSSSDAITNINQPTFNGIAQANTKVLLFGAPVGSATFTYLGQASSDSSGAWSIKSIALPDGRYTIEAREIDASGNLIATTTIQPNSMQGALTIDTVGPRVTGIALNRLGGQLTTNFSDNLSGLDPTTLYNSANFLFSRRGFPVLAYQIDGIGLTYGSGGQTATVVLTVNGGRGLRGGQYTITILSGSGATGVRDIAGNALDGEFYSTFPSGDGRPGGNFVAVIDTMHNVIYPAKSVVGKVGPLGPGIRQQRTYIPTINPYRPLVPITPAAGRFRFLASRANARPASARSRG